MSSLDWTAVVSARLVRDPFDHTIIPQVLTAEAAAGIPAEFPSIRQPGSFPLADAPPGPVLSSVIAEMQSDGFRIAMQRLFDVDLQGRPIVVTLRGQCGPRDGRVHTDSASKILSLLLHLNEGWNSDAGRLRLLGRASDLASPAVEVSPAMGTLLVFRRCDHSWHGHTPYVGPRRVLQMNCVNSNADGLASSLRHRLSALRKRLVA